MRKAKTVVLTCATCSKEFERKPYRIRSEISFCSHACQVNYLVEGQGRARTIELTCDECGVLFTRGEAYHRATLKKGVKNTFCSKKCMYAFQRKQPSGAEIATLVCDVCGETFTRLKRIEKQLRKEFAAVCCSRKCAQTIANRAYGKDAPFRFFLNAMRRNTRGIDVSISLVDLIEQWELQDGVCPYTGVRMELKTSKSRGRRRPYQASIDRIDSSKGYVRGNVEFVSMIANYAKHTWGKDDVIDFGKRVAEQHRG